MFLTKICIVINFSCYFLYDVLNSQHIIQGGKINEKFIENAFEWAIFMFFLFS